MRWFLLLLGILVLCYVVVGALQYKKVRSEVVGIIAEDLAFDMESSNFLSAHKKIETLRRLGFSDLSVRNEKKEVLNETSFYSFMSYERPITLDGVVVGFVLDKPSKFTILNFILANTYLTIGFFIIFILLIIYLIRSYRMELKIQKSDLMADMSRQLAHDIRSPISTLNIISYQIKDPHLKSLQMTVVDQINQIANDLLNKSKNFRNSDPVCVAHFINDLKSEFNFKKSYYKRNIEFNYSVDELSNVNIEKPLATVLYRIISNCILNAVEATSEEAGNVVISSKISSNELIVEIKDNGTGISDELLNKLGNEEISSLKSSDKYNSGSGIALFNARKDLKKFSSTLKILSKENVGTTVKIKVPLEKNK